MSRSAKEVRADADKANVAITPASKTRFVKWLKANRSPNIAETVGAIADWFSVQPKVVTDVVLNDVPSQVRKAYADALRELANQVEHGDPHQNVSSQTQLKAKPGTPGHQQTDDAAHRPRR